MKNAPKKPQKREKFRKLARIAEARGLTVDELVLGLYAKHQGIVPIAEELSISYYQVQAWVKENTEIATRRELILKNGAGK